jgi:hypothetical protein
LDVVVWIFRMGMFDGFVRGGNVKE